MGDQDANRKVSGGFLKELSARRRNQIRSVNLTFPCGLHVTDIGVGVLVAKSVERRSGDE